MTLCNAVQTPSSDPNMLPRYWISFPPPLFFDMLTPPESRYPLTRDTRLVRQLRVLASLLDKRLSRPAAYIFTRYNNPT